MTLACHSMLQQVLHTEFCFSCFHPLLMLHDDAIADRGRGTILIYTHKSDGGSAYQGLVAAIEIISLYLYTKSYGRAAEMSHFSINTDVISCLNRAFEKKLAYSEGDHIRRMAILSGVCGRSLINPAHEYAAEKVIVYPNILGHANLLRDQFHLIRIIPVSVFFVFCKAL